MIAPLLIAAALAASAPTAHDWTRFGYDAARSSSSPIAIDAANGRILWRYTPPGYSSWAGSYRITNATPVADPSRTAIYTASPDGRIHKLSVADGSALWSTAITRLPQREKIAAALNFSRGLAIATTGGY